MSTNKYRRKRARDHDAAQPAGQEKKEPTMGFGGRFMELWKQSSLTDRIIAIFTGVLAAAAIYQFIIMNGQLDVMRKDQRAWVKFEQAKEAGDQVTSQFTTGEPLSFPVRFVNTGKTPANHVQVKVFVSLITAGTEPPLEDPDSGIIPWYISLSAQSGIIFPESDIKNVATRTTKDGGSFPLTEAEFNAIRDGTSYLAAWGTVTYDDVFQVPHWTKFCYWISSKSHKSERCSQYNSVDSN
jgi:hypothetical protein